MFLHVSYIVCATCYFFWYLNVGCPPFFKVLFRIFPSCWSFLSGKKTPECSEAKSKSINTRLYHSRNFVPWFSRLTYDTLVLETLQYSSPLWVLENNYSNIKWCGLYNCFSCSAVSTDFVTWSYCLLVKVVKENWIWIRPLCFVINLSIVRGRERWGN